MTILDFVFYTFIGVVIIQVIFYLIFFRRFAFLKQKETSKNNIPVSIIICAKNEAKNLQVFLPSIISQDYPDFEIILINDASSDNTLDVMTQFSNTHSNIKIVDVKNVETFWGNKKYALTLGIKTSKNDLLLFTDADCKPVSKYWIKEMCSHIKDKKTITLGYGAYSKIKNSFLNKLIRFETLITAIQYFSFAKMGMSYMGVGRNLAYTRKVFFDANGFTNHIKVLSGDDDLFVNQVSTNKNTAICFSKESFTESIPNTKYKNWYKQKRRHISSAKHYKLKHKILLSLIYITNLLFWSLAVFLFTNSYNLFIVLGLFALRLTIQYIIIGFSAKKLKEKDLLVLLPFLELFLIISQFIIFINNLILKPNHWK